MPRVRDTGHLTLRERLGRIETTLEKVNTRINFIIYALIAAGATGGGLVGIEAIAQTLN